MTRLSTLTFLLSSFVNTITALILPNLTSIPPTLLNPSTLSFPGRRCYPRNTRYDFEEALVPDCRQLVRDIANLDRTYRGQKFTFGTADAPGVDKVVPVTYTRKSCAVHVIDTESTQATYDSFTLRYVSQKLDRMTDFCVVPAPHLGGEDIIGVKEILAIVVTGIARPQDARLQRLWDGFVVTPGIWAPAQGREVS